MHLRWWSDVPEHLRIPWNELVRGMESPQVFFTWEWAAAVSSTLGRSPWIVTACDGDALVGVASFAKISNARVEFLCATTADYCDFMSRPELRSEFVERVLGDLKAQGISAVVLANLPADSSTISALKGARRFRSFVRFGYECPHVQLGTNEEREALIRSLSKKKMLRRNLSLLEWMGHITLRFRLGTEVRTTELQEFCEMHVARFLRTSRVSNLVQSERRKFLGELSQLLAEGVEVTELCVGDRVVASNFGFNFEGTRFWYQPTLDNDVEGFSPGFCLLAKLIEDSCTNPRVRVIDLGLGAEGYKERFANGQRTTLHATLSKHTIADWITRARYWGATYAKKYPRLEKVAREVRSAAIRSKRRAREEGLLPTMMWLGSRLRRLLVSRDDVLFFRWTGCHGAEHESALAALDWKMLALTAMRFPHDEHGLEYLMRAADRLHSKMHNGYALVAPDGSVEHVTWAAPYDGFAMAELGITLQAPSPSSVMIFDCWTPSALRGRGLYRMAIASLAERLSGQGADVWIFGAVGNSASLAGIERSGFEKQFSMVRWKVLGWSRVRKKNCSKRYGSEEAAMDTVRHNAEIAPQK